MNLYLYRALNDLDIGNLKNNGIIEASSIPNTSEQMLNDIADHVYRASSQTQKDCWISAGKDLDIIINEYAIPQGGNYNTGTARKNVAVIDLSYWKVMSSIKDSYTVFCNQNGIIVDFSKYTSKSETDKIRYVKEIQDILGEVFAVNNGSDIRALFDCSHTGNSKAEFNKMQIMRYSKYKMGNGGNIKSYGLFTNLGLSAISNGITKDAKEVLCYREIPQSAIATILTPIQQDVLYLLNDEGKSTLIDSLSKGVVKIEWDERNNEAIIEINNVKHQVSGEGWMYPSMIFEEIAREIVQNGRNIKDLENEYNNYGSKKKQLLLNIINILGLTPFVKEIPEIPEIEGLWVCDFDLPGCVDGGDKVYDVRKKKLYDLALFRYKGNIYTVRSVPGCSVGNIGDISKTNTLIKEIIQEKKLKCTDLDKY